MLISCQECHANISEAALACPQCGAPPDVFKGAAQPCAECKADFRPAYSDCRSCGAPRSVAIIASRDAADIRVPVGGARASWHPGAPDHLQASKSTRRESGWRWVKWVLILVGATLAGRLTIAMSTGDTEMIVGSLVGTLGAGLLLGGAAFGLGWFFASK